MIFWLPPSSFATFTQIFLSWKNSLQAFFLRGIINAHPSLLPRWHGAAPIIHTILNGDVRTGVTIIGLSVGRFAIYILVLIDFIKCKKPEWEFICKRILKVEFGP